MCSQFSAPLSWTLRLQNFTDEDVATSRGKKNAAFSNIRADRAIQVIALNSSSLTCLLLKLSQKTP